MEIILKTDDLTTVTGAAQFLNVARTTIYRWCRDGKILTIRLNGRILIPISEIERLQPKG